MLANCHLGEELVPMLCERALRGPSAPDAARTRACPQTACRSCQETTKPGGRRPCVPGNLLTAPIISSETSDTTPTICSIVRRSTRPQRARPSLAKSKFGQVWLPSLAKPSLAKTKFGQTSNAFTQTRLMSAFHLSVEVARRGLGVLGFRSLGFRVLGFEPSPSPQKNVSLRGDAGADKNEGRWGGTPPKKNVSLRGPGLTFPNVKNDRGKHKSTKSQCFFL